jgi:hypothetical protein
MKTSTIQQEILLVTTSTFSNRELCEKGNSGHKQSQSNIEQLEEACWNGLLDEWLPEIIAKPVDGKRLYLWHIRHGETFLQIELSELPLSVDKPFSIDTNFFLPALIMN